MTTRCDCLVRSSSHLAILTVAQALWTERHLAYWMTGVSVLTLAVCCRFLDQHAQVTDTFLYSWNPCSPFTELTECQSVSVSLTTVTLSSDTE